MIIFFSRIYNTSTFPMFHNYIILLIDWLTHYLMTCLKDRNKCKNPAIQHALLASISSPALRQMLEEMLENQKYSLGVLGRKG